MNRHARFNWEVPARLDFLRRCLKIEPDNPTLYDEIIFLMDADERASVEDQQAIRREWALSVYKTRARGGVMPLGGNPFDHDAFRPLRIGYVSGDFRRHSAYQCFSSVIYYRDRSQFSAHLYSSTRPHEHDAATEILKRESDSFTDASSLSDYELAQKIYSDCVDILVDLSGISALNRLGAFALKPAPVQVSAFGYPTGTQLSEIDYLISDKIFIPESDRHLYRESFIDLPCVIGFETLEHAPAVGALPSGLGRPFTFGCYNRVFKYSHNCLALIGEIVNSVPGARVIFKDMSFENASFRQQFIDHVKPLGLYYKKNLILRSKTSRLEHLQQLNDVDVQLDSFPQTGGVSTVEALIMGVPVVTLEGKTPTARVSSSILKSIGAGEWVAYNAEQYRQIALRAAIQSEWLTRIRRALRYIFTSHAVGDPVQYVSLTDRAYREAWQKYCEGKNGKQNGKR